MRSHQRLLLALLALRGAAACGGAADVSSLGADKTSDLAPSLPALANAGADREILRGYQASLDATGTYHPARARFSVLWEQISGPRVFLSNVAELTPSFMAPLDECALAFRLTADDGHFVTTDEVTLLVRRTPSHTAPRVRAGADRFLDYGVAAEPGAADIVQMAPDDATSAWEHVVAQRSPALVGDSPALLGELFRLSARAAGLDSAPDYLVLWPFSEPMRGERPPIGSAETTLVVEPGAPFTLDASGSSDPNGDAISLRWVQLRGDRMLAAAVVDRVVSLTAPWHPQELAFRLMASDGVLESAPVDVTVLVRMAVGAMPAAPGNNVDLRAHPGNAVRLEAMPATSRSGGDETFAWLQTVGLPVTLAVDGDGEVAHLVAPSITEPSADLAFAVVSRCGEMTSDPAVVRLTVIPPQDNEPPTITLCPSTTAPVAGQVVGIRVALADPENDRLASLQWRAPDALGLAPATESQTSWSCTTESAPDLPLEDGFPSSWMTVSFVAPASGTQTTLALDVCDELGACGQAGVTVHVQ
jgi:hypothetical protein